MLKKKKSPSSGSLIDLHKIMSTRDSKYVGKWKVHFLKSSLKDYWLFKTKIALLWDSYVEV